VETAFTFFFQYSNHPRASSQFNSSNFYKSFFLFSTEAFVIEETGIRNVHVIAEIILTLISVSVCLASTFVL